MPEKASMSWLRFCLICTVYRVDTVSVWMMAGVRCQASQYEGINHMKIGRPGD